MVYHWIDALTLVRDMGCDKYRETLMISCTTARRVYGAHEESPTADSLAV
jgi:hypothetical protein